MHSSMYYIVTLERTTQTDKVIHEAAMLLTPLEQEATMLTQRGYVDFNTSKCVI
jgi:hypothetical protein